MSAPGTAPTAAYVARSSATGRKVPSGARLSAVGTLTAPGDVARDRVDGLVVAGVALRRPRVDQQVDGRDVLELDDGHRAGPSREVAGLRVGRTRLGRATGRQPRVPAAIEDPHPRVAVEAQQPPGPRGRAAGPVVVHDHEPVAAHTHPPHGRLEVLPAGQRVPSAGARRDGGRRAEIGVHVDVRRPRDVARLELRAAGRAAGRVAHVEQGDVGVGVQLLDGDQRGGHSGDSAGGRPGLVGGPGDGAPGVASCDRITTRGRTALLHRHDGLRQEHPGPADQPQPRGARPGRPDLHHPRPGRRGDPLQPAGPAARRDRGRAGLRLLELRRGHADPGRPDRLPDLRRGPVLHRRPDRPARPDRRRAPDRRVRVRHPHRLPHRAVRGQRAGWSSSPTG